MKRVYRKIEKKFIGKLNQFQLRTKLFYMYLLCVLLPLFITDSIVLGLVFNAEHEKNQIEMDNVSESVARDLTDTVDAAAALANRFYANSGMNDYLEKNYQNPGEYFIHYYSQLQNTMKLVNMNDLSFVFYSDNDTIVPGGSFLHLDSAEDELWYSRLEYAQKEGVLCFYFETDKSLVSQPQRTVSYIRKLSYYRPGKYRKYVKCNIDYSAIVRKMMNRHYAYTIYVCNGERILYSNEGTANSSISQDFNFLSGKEDIAYRKDFEYNGMKFSVLVMKPKSNLFQVLKERYMLILFMLAVNVLLPLIFMNMINKSFTARIYLLGDYFSDLDIDHMRKIETVDGEDEISLLMRNYNRMVDRSNELIQTVYKSRIESQETDLAKQNAELLALQSQINPHFLFNTLESIRMHSVLKNENETADVLERLAALLRKNVDWTRDESTVAEEVQFVIDYLTLQKYRFGDRLQYELEIDDDCNDFSLPKLSLVTFVENACVHGMEGKAGKCTIYIRVYQKKGFLYLETEDTGSGIEDDLVEKLNDSMNHCTIDMVKESKHVGMLNACLRLKMVTDDEVVFDLESEKGLGTYMLIKIPIDKLTKEDK